MKFGLLGRKLGHSYSPQIHKLIGQYSYDLYEREPEEVETLLHQPDIAGLNVTMPYKKDVIPYLDTIDELATRLGSVNTIVRKPDGTLEGHNTDYYGFMSMVKHSGLSVSGKKALILGSGGASVTAVAVMEDLGARVVTISRSGENNYHNLSRHADASFIVNATPVGMFPNTGAAPLNIARFPKLEGVFDFIYNPARTQLLLDCERANIPAFNGLWMLVAQAKRAAEYFTGTTLPSQIIHEIYQNLRKQMENIVLIGMAGCGKSTVGKLLADQCGKEFVDADEEIQKLAGKTIPEIFEQDGEEIFRDLETRVLSDLGRQSGLVIATGGGCVTKERNYPLLHQNGTIIWIQRDGNALPTHGRPLSQQTNPAILYEQRKPLYASFSDKIVPNDGTIAETAEKICSLLEESK